MVVGSVGEEVVAVGVEVTMRKRVKEAVELW